MNFPFRHYFNSFNTKQLLQAATALSFAAAVVHGIVTPEHFEEWWGYGLFFMVITLLQGAYGILLLGYLLDLDERGELKSSALAMAGLLYRVGIVGNALVIVFYIITRTIGIPFFGPEAGEVEDVSAISLLSKIVEIALIFVLLLLAQRLRSTKVTI